MFPPWQILARSTYFSTVLNRVVKRGWVQHRSELERTHPATQRKYLQNIRMVLCFRATTPKPVGAGG